MILTRKEAAAKSIEILDKYEVAYTLRYEEDGIPIVDVDLAPLEEDGINNTKSAMSEIYEFFSANELIP